MVVFLPDACTCTGTFRIFRGAVQTLARLKHLAQSVALQNQVWVPMVTLRCPASLLGKAVKPTADAVAVQTLIFPALGPCAANGKRRSVKAKRKDETYGLGAWMAVVAVARESAHPLRLNTITVTIIPRCRCGRRASERPCMGCRQTYPAGP
jgi:hypothetical protein